MQSVRSRTRRSTHQPSPDDLRPECAPSLIQKGVKGKYSARYRRGTNLALLEPDVATVFPTPKSVNDALRLLIKVAGAVPKTTRK